MTASSDARREPVPETGNHSDLLLLTFPLSAFLLFAGSLDTGSSSPGSRETVVLPGGED
jgi:hypothetical protein